MHRPRTTHIGTRARGAAAHRARGVWAARALLPFLSLGLVPACTPSPEPPRIDHGVALLLKLTNADVRTSLDVESAATPSAWSVLLDESAVGSNAWAAHSGPRVAALLAASQASDPSATEPPGEDPGWLRVPAPGAILRFVPVERDRLCRVTVETRGDAVSARAELVEFLAPENPAALTDLDALRDLFAASQAQVIELAADDEAGGTLSATFSSRRDAASALLCVIADSMPVDVGRVRVEAPSRSISQLLRPQPASYPSAYVKRVDVSGDHRPAAILRTPAILDVALGGAIERPALDFALASLTGGLANVRARVTFRSASAEDARDVEARGVGAESWSEFRVGPGNVPSCESVRIELRSAGADEVDVALASPFVAPAHAPSRPDVVCVSLDTMRADRMPGDRALATNPNFARLARRSAVFSCAVAAAAYTLPSHVSILSGQYPDHHRVAAMTDAIRQERVPMLALDFCNAGYRTVAFTGGGFVHPDFGFAIGFQHYETRDLAADVRRVRFAATARDAGATPRLDALRRVIADRSAPLFLFVHTYAAHNYAAAEDDMRAAGVDPGELEPLLARLGSGGVLEGLRSLGATESERALLRGLYDASARSADAVLGVVVDELARAGRLDQTILVVLSDHGEELFERGALGHGHSVFEEVVRVPLLVHGPGIAARRLAEPVSLVDVAPTLRDLCGLDPHADAVDGISLAAALRDGETDVPPHPLLSRSSTRDRGRVRAYRAGTWKLIAKEKGSKTASALFDLAADPGEWHDVSAAHPDGAAHALGELQRRTAALRARSAGSSAARVTVDTADELRALGYLGGH